jgi:hypothetical protein
MIQGIKLHVGCGVQLRTPHGLFLFQLCRYEADDLFSQPGYAACGINILLPVVAYTSEIRLGIVEVFSFACHFIYHHFASMIIRKMSVFSTTHCFHHSFCCDQRFQHETLRSSRTSDLRPHTRSCLTRYSRSHQRFDDHHKQVFCYLT